MSSALIAHRIANATMGVIYAVMLATFIGWMWPGIGLPVFITFLLGWTLDSIKTLRLERRYPELISSPDCKIVRIRYKPSELGEGEYEVTLAEFITGQAALISLGIPLASLVGGLVGLLWPAGRVIVFAIILSIWTAVMLLGILHAVNKHG
jgi:hypothetical protein